MVAGHSSIKRIVHRIGEECRSTAEIARADVMAGGVGDLHGEGGHPDDESQRIQRTAGGAQPSGTQA